MQQQQAEGQINKQIDDGVKGLVKTHNKTN